MALSEQEQRMLAEIERALIAEDPHFAQGSKNTEHKTFSLNIRSIALILLGICFLVGGIALAQVSLWFVVLSVIGFVIMFGGGILGFQDDSASNSRGEGRKAGSKAKAKKKSQNARMSDRMEDRFKKRFER